MTRTANARKMLLLVSWARIQWACDDEGLYFGIKHG